MNSPLEKKLTTNAPALDASRLTFERQLRSGAQALGLQMSDDQFERLLAYMALLVKWNAVYNLTAIRDPVLMLSNHLLDCLAVVGAFQDAKRVLDVGAGAGLPGIILAIWALEAAPAMHISLIDTVHKKTAFLQQVKAELRLDNVTVITGRVEQLKLDAKLTGPFDIITSRAFAELSDFITWSAHLLASDGHFLAMKGAVPADEIARLAAPWAVSEIRPLSVPMLSAQRHLIRIARQPGKNSGGLDTDSLRKLANALPAGLQYGPDHAAGVRHRTT